MLVCKGGAHGVVRELILVGQAPTSELTEASKPSAISFAIVCSEASFSSRASESACPISGMAKGFRDSMSLWTPDGTSQTVFCTPIL
jgi:translation initiation factor 2B subunit (eIF-2B alpha/beta/delta family)